MRNFASSRENIVKRRVNQTAVYILPFAKTRSFAKLLSARPCLQTNRGISKDVRIKTIVRPPPAPPPPREIPTRGDGTERKNWSRGENACAFFAAAICVPPPPFVRMSFSLFYFQPAPPSALSFSRLPRPPAPPRDPPPLSSSFRRIARYAGAFLRIVPQRFRPSQSIALRSLLGPARQAACEIIKICFENMLFYFNAIEKKRRNSFCLIYPQFFFFRIKS